MKALVEMNNMLKHENEKLKQENEQLKRMVKAYKEKEYKIIHKIQLWQMDGEITIRDLQDILQILNDKVVE